ncbi:MAG: DNA polymerase, partial [Nitrososphaera sp.]|nr:DNA polymerase [Nitrososphaera sp.]
SSAESEWLYPVSKKQPNGQYVTKLVPTWPALVHKHVEHWATNLDAQAYAEDDIHMLRKLYVKFGSPESDEDGMVACQVASVRLRGFDIDVEGVAKLREESVAIVASAQLNVNSPKQVAGYVAEALDPMEQMILKAGCDQKIIDSIKIEFNLKESEECYCEKGLITGYNDSDPSARVPCKRCNGIGTVGPGPMPVVDRVEHIESIRKHTKRVELFDKLLLARRAYPDFNVIGTKSGRMSGASGLNFQGVDHSDVVRSLFTLAGPAVGSWDCETGTMLNLSAGDYESQELAIAATAMRDEDLMEDMASGKKLHGLFAAQAFETTYEDIMANKDDGRYVKGKGGVFAILYGGTFQTVARNMGIEVEIAEGAYNRMVAKYPQMGNTRKKITEKFSSMHQNEDGKIEYRDPPEKFIESVFGFRRYFETEYEIQRMILSVIRNMPQQWKDIELKVERKEGKIQSMSGALCSALYGAAFSIQNKIIRASNNHVIQATGRHLTVGMQAALWSIQPQGIRPFRLTLMSIHDELAVVCPPQFVDKVNEVIEEKV